MLEQSVQMLSENGVQGAARHVPAAQNEHSRQACAPLTFWYLSLGHGVQTAVPSSSACEPARHGTHALAFVLPGTGLYLPRGHATHATLLLAPSSSLYEPAGHIWKTRAEAAPASGQKPPLGHAVHAVEFSWSLNFPAGHTMHCGWPA